jgi:hypothetical protein
MYHSGPVCGLFIRARCSLCPEYDLDVGIIVRSVTPVAPKSWHLKRGSLNMCTLVLDGEPLLFL